MSQNPNIQIIAQKSFHNNNLTLQLEYLIDMDIYHINIHRHNNLDNISLFGIFTTLHDAQIKFNSISL